MRYLIERIKERVINSVEGAGLKSPEVEVPPEHIKAIFAVPCFKYAKALKKPPAEIARDVVEKISVSFADGLEFFERVEAEGPYINFYADWNAVASRLFHEILEKRDSYGKDDLGTGKRILIDMSSPNIAKPMSVGHLRSTIIGDSLARIFSFLGYEVIRDNHLGDWGTQFGKLLCAYKLWGKKDEIEREGVKALLDLYVRFHQEAEKNPELEEKAREEFSKLEKGDDENRKLWKWFIDISINEFKRIYQLLGVDFELWLGESFYIPMCDDVVRDALEKGIAEIDESGAVVVKLEKYGLPNLIIRKSDESTLYSTRDLATIRYRVEKFDPWKILYVVGSEQRLYFQQVFRVAELLGYATHERLVHVDFGLVRLPEGKMSTRKGRVVFLEDVINEAIERAKKIVVERNPEIQGKDLEEIARKVGIAAIKFADLSQNRVKEVVFEWDKMISFEGDTGPYLQYTYVRAKSIMEKAQQNEVGKAAKLKNVILTEEVEKELVRKLLFFPAVVREASEHYEPHRIASQLLEVAHMFNSFYQNVPVLKAEREELRHSRLKLVESTSIIIKTGLELLGIEVMERM